MSTRIADLLKHAQAELRDSSPTASLDAELLLAHVLGASRSQLLAHPERLIPKDQQQRFLQLTARRDAGEPVAYLTGTREFWSLALKVTPATLIPRPETELLVEQTLQLIAPSAHSELLDLGTGSGAIALALARERPGCRITATDISTAALEIAEENAAELGIHNVRFVRGSWFEPVSDLRFQLIVANPPYVTEGELRRVSGDLRFEPVEALVSGPDGLDAMRAIIRDAHDHLEKNGALLLEHGRGQAEAARDLMRAAGFTQVRSARDLAGIERVCAGTFGVASV